MTQEQDAPIAGPSRKLSGWELYRNVMKSPKHIVAPMVDQSELPWRILSRRYGAELVYTPMINAKLFVDPQSKKYREQSFNMEHGEEGGTSDRPLIVQFAANNPSFLLESAKAVEPYCDAVDINFGCPQDIARRGRYGAFLCEDWDLIHSLISTLHKHLNIPVTAKFRIFPEVEKTIRYAKMMENAGAQILTCHGRTREQRGHNTGLADWSQIQAVKQAVSVPVFANGNVIYPEDIAKCLEVTGADAYMSAEPQLHNPAIFVPLSSDPDSLTVPCAKNYPLSVDIALEYMEIVQELKTPTMFSSIKAHLFQLLLPALSRETDLRAKLGRLTSKDGIASYVEICQELKQRMQRDIAAARWDPSNPESYNFPTNPDTGIKTIPHWLVQPKIRPPRPVPSKQTSIKPGTQDTTRVLVPQAAENQTEVRNVHIAQLLINTTSLVGGKRKVEEVDGDSAHASLQNGFKGVMKKVQR